MINRRVVELFPFYDTPILMLFHDISNTYSLNKTSDNTSNLKNSLRVFQETSYRF
jgi:hypothetical protein